MRNVVVYAKYPNYGPTGNSGPGRIWVAAPNGEHRRFLTVGCLPSLSPDGRYVAYTSGRKVLVVPTAGGRPRVLGRGDWGLTWAPNSRYLAFVRLLRLGSGEVVIDDAESGSG